MQPVSLIFKSVLCLVTSYSCPAGSSSYGVVLMSVGVVASVAVFPIGLGLLIATYCCCHGNTSAHKRSYSPSPSKCSQPFIVRMYAKLHASRASQVPQFCTTLDL